MIGRKVKSDWFKIEGEIIGWEPLGAGMCDVLVRETGGRVCWYSSRDLTPTDGGGPLPSREAVRRAADEKALEDLQVIRADLVRDFDRPWPGMEFGKAIFGMSLDGAIEEIEKRLK